MILNICEVIVKLILAGGMGVVCGLFSYFLDYCFWPGSIFKWYLPWLARIVLKRSKPEKMKTVREMDDEYYIHHAEQLFWYKILGGCSVCFNIWIAMISWAVICPLSFFEWYFGFAYILVSSYTIRKQVGAVYQ